MAKYEVTFSCGHTDTVQLVGPVKERERKIKWFEESGLCPDCFRAQREAERKALEEERREETEAASANAEAMGLPQLIGTEKQVAWAVRIRQKFVEDALMILSDEDTEDARRARRAFHYIVDTVTSASEWIDNRYNAESADLLILKYIDKADEPNPADIAREVTVEPTERKYPGAVEIRIGEHAIAASYQKNEDFRTIVKGLGYAWGDGWWRRRIGIREGGVAERAAELGNKLLHSGFAVQIPDERIRKMAIDGAYEPESKRWITYYVSGEYKGWLCISWEKGNEDIYRKVRALPGSRWSRPDVAVPVSSYREVLDLADILGFKVSKGAQEAIEAHKSGIQVVAPQKASESGQTDKLGEILKSSTDVIDDLKDE